MQDKDKVPGKDMGKDVAKCKQEETSSTKKRRRKAKKAAMKPKKLFQDDEDEDPCDQKIEATDTFLEEKESVQRADFTDKEDSDDSQEGVMAGSEDEDADVFGGEFEYKTPEKKTGRQRKRDEPDPSVSAGRTTGSKSSLEDISPGLAKATDEALQLKEKIDKRILECLPHQINPCLGFIFSNVVVSRSLLIQALSQVRLRQHA